MFHLYSQMVIFYFTGSWLNQLKKDLHTTQRKAFATGTIKNLQSQWKKFLQFSSLMGRVMFPISTDDVCLYIQFLTRSLKSPQSVRNYLSGLKTLHTLCDMPFPSNSSVSIRLTLRGVDKQVSHVPKRALPMTPQILVRIYRLLDMSSPDHSVFWCLFLFLFFLFSRKSQFIPQSPSDPHIPKLVTRGDIVFHDGVVNVLFRWTKTRQTGGEPLVIPLLPIPGSVLCPVTAFLNMTQLVPAPSTAPAFVLPMSTGVSLITYPTFHAVLRSFLSRLGLKPQSFSSHSFRRGGASFAFSIGIPGEQIQKQGDWLSDAYKVYLEVNYEQRVAVARAMSKALDRV